MTPQEIEQIIEMLAEKLGPIGGQVWAIYMRQVYVDVIGSVMWMAAFLVGAIVSITGGEEASYHAVKAGEAAPMTKRLAPPWYSFSA